MTRVNLTPQTLYPAQHDAIYPPTRHGLVEASTKTGKTFGASQRQLIAWLAGPGPGDDAPWYEGAASGLHLWSGPSDDTVEMAFRAVVRHIQPLIEAGIVSVKRSAPRQIERPDGAIWRFQTTDNLDQVYGREWDSVVMEEYSRQREESFEALQSTIGPRRGWMLLIGNVKDRVGWAWQIARAVEEGGDAWSDWTYTRLTAWDAADARENWRQWCTGDSPPALPTREEIEAKREQFRARGKLAIFRRDYEANPDGTGTAFADAIIERMQTADPVEHGPCVMGVDPGGRRNPAGIVVWRIGYGDDGMRLGAVEQMHWLGEPSALARVVIDLYQEYGAEHVCLDRYMPLLVDQLVERLGKSRVSTATGTAKNMGSWYGQLHELAYHGRVCVPDGPLLDDCRQAALDDGGSGRLVLPEYDRTFVVDGTNETRPVHCDALDAALRTMAVVGRYTRQRGSASTAGESRSRSAASAARAWM